MRRTRVNKQDKMNYTRKRGSGVSSSKSKQVYPLLPPSPTNRPNIKVNNENLKRVEKGSNEYKKRSNYLLKLRKGLPNIQRVENSFFRPNNRFSISKETRS